MFKYQLYRTKEECIPGSGDGEDDGQCWFSSLCFCLLVFLVSLSFSLCFFLCFWVFLILCPCVAPLSLSFCFFGFVWVSSVFCDVPVLGFLFGLALCNFPVSSFFLFFCLFSPRDGCLVGFL